MSEQLLQLPPPPPNQVGDPLWGQTRAMRRENAQALAAWEAAMAQWRRMARRQREGKA